MRERVATRLAAAAVLILLAEVVMATALSPKHQRTRIEACDSLGGFWDEKHRVCALRKPWCSASEFDCRVKMMSPASPLDPYWWLSLVS